MSEKPILFTTPMVEAILEGHKKMTRRVADVPMGFPVCKTEGNEVNYALFYTEDGRNRTSVHPRYQIGDILWVRETHRIIGFNQAAHTIMFEYFDEKQAVYSFAPDRFKKFYKEDLTDKKRPSLFLPREAARIFLKVRDVRIERLQDISEEDAKAEGLGIAKCNYTSCVNAICSKNYCFKKLWDTLNAKRGYGWDTNCFVWVYEFGRV